MVPERLGGVAATLKNKQRRFKRDHYTISGGLRIGWGRLFAGLHRFISGQRDEGKEAIQQAEKEVSDDRAMPRES
ncbi:MAG: hypothetical protein ACJASX_003516, partial [Limisphaerales bacterium]